MAYSSNARYAGYESRRQIRKRKKLKPAGHSATIEALIQPAIVVGSTLMSVIAAYVLASDEIGHVLAGGGTMADWFVIALCGGMGFLIDMAIIVSATRYKMHAVRADPREDRWLSLAKWVLGIGLSSEAMTLFYFFVHLDTGAFPGPLVAAAGIIHAVLAVARAFLPPVVIAYFAAGVLPVMFDRSDRNREIKSRTSSNIMTLVDRLSEVEDTDDKAEMLRALGGQLMLDTYATYDETARTTEDEQLRRDGKLLAHMARINHLDWSAIAPDVAPELRADTPEPTPARRLSPREARRAALERDMYGVRGHPTTPRDGGADDGPDESDSGWSLRGIAEDYGAFDDDGPAAFNHSRPAMQQRTAPRRAAPARMQPRASELAVDLPKIKTPIEKGDSDERKRVLRYLDRNPGASVPQIMAGAQVSKQIAKAHKGIWIERRNNLNMSVPTFTQEIPAILPEMLAQATAEA